MWPEFNIWNFYMGILNYQLSYDSIQKIKLAVKERIPRSLKSSCEKKSLDTARESTGDLICIKNHRANSFLTNLHNTRCRKIEQIAAAS